MLEIQDLFNMQEELDQYIEKKQNLQDSRQIENRIMALQVEIGELTNEWKGFKFWKRHKDIDRDKLKAEYSDCIHFLLSIGNKLGTTNITIETSAEEHNTTLEAIMNCHESLLHIYTAWHHDMEASEMQIIYNILFSQIISLGEYHFNITWSDIEQAYLDKNQINYSRQNNNY